MKSLARTAPAESNSYDRKKDLCHTDEYSFVGQRSFFAVQIVKRLKHRQPGKGGFSPLAQAS